MFQKSVAFLFALTLLLGGGVIISAAAQETSAPPLGDDPCRVTFDRGALVYDCDYGGGTTAVTSYRIRPAEDQIDATIYDVVSRFTLTGGILGSYDLKIGSVGPDVRYDGTILVGKDTFVVNCTINTQTGTFSGSNCGGIGLIANPQSGGDAAGELTDSDPNQAAGAFVLSVLLPDIRDLEQVARLEKDVRRAVLRNQVRTERRSLQRRFRSVSRYMFLRKNGNGSRSGPGTNLNRNSPFVTLGKNAGDGEGIQVGLWTDVSYSDVETSTSGEESEGDSLTGLIGLDTLLLDDLVLGMYGGYLESDTDLNFLDGEQNADGYIVGAYAAYVLDGQTSLDVSLSYGQQETEIAFPQSGLDVVGRYDSDRVGGAVNLTRYEPVNEWLLTGVVGYSHTREKADPYTLSDGSAQTGETINLGLVSLNGEASYGGFGAFSPYISLALEYEVTKAEDVDRATFIPTLGIRYGFLENLDGGMSVSKQYMQQDEDVTTVNANLRYSF